MTLRIAQESSFEGEDWWKWSVWIQGPDSELDQVREVTWVLHRTFPKPVRVVKDRQSNFRLDASGWGVFRIFATLALEGDKQLELHHDLELRYPDGRPTTA